MSRRYFVLREPVHGDVYLSKDEGRILDTREMQRLRGISQLGLAHLVFPGARHSRFEHSIGTLHMTSRLVSAVNRNAGLESGYLRGVDEHEERLLRAAALVHDVTHIPFGHNIEDQTGLLPRHDSPERFSEMLSPQGELGAELKAQGLLDGVLGILGAGEEPAAPFLPQMISDTICSDLMDYLRRDAWYTGLDLRYDDRIADYFKIDSDSGRLFVDCEKQGLLREDIVSEILRMLQARYYFSERVYYHHAKIAAGAMVSRAVEIALLEGWIEARDLYDKTDEGLLILLRALASNHHGEHAEAAASLLDRLAARRLFKRVSVFPYADNREVQGRLLERFFSPKAAEGRRAWEQAREDEFEEKFGRREMVLLYCPSRKMQLKEVGTLVRFPGEPELRALSAFRDRLPRIADLEESYLRLWKVYALTSATDPEERDFLQSCIRASLPDAHDAYRITR